MQGKAKPRALRIPKGIGFDYECEKNEGIDVLNSAFARKLTFNTILPMISISKTIVPIFLYFKEGL